MRCVFLVLFVCLSRLSFAEGLPEWFGVPLEESIYSPKDKSVTLTVLRDDKLGAVYRYTHKNDPGAVVWIKVSKSTGKIYDISWSFPHADIYRVIGVASLICSGTVYMPDRASGGILPLKLTPFGIHKDKYFQMSVGVSSGHMVLDVHCDEYMIKRD